MEPIIRTERSNIRSVRRKTPSAYRRDRQRKVDYENRKHNDNVNVNPGIPVPPKSITSVSTASHYELLNNNIRKITLTICCQCGRLEVCQIAQKYQEIAIVFLNIFICCHLKIRI